MKKNKFAVGTVAVLLSAGLATATDAATVIAQVICGLIPEVINLAWVLALLVFIYGGAKYAYSADDPGQRKAAKGVAINALIGFIIVGASRGVVQAIAVGATICP